ncbi:response regulator [Oculatella sp. LEGE 06141]|uniref:response regulator n=1 Tax=Oculatella sp. LEGE 06141 TaxID=1828648 RepID=UPI0018805947|nr:response regulator [Oculatella sp. LEGE 06141]MBE9182330.1 response regulator [Oculatella sp. LEGE 06141]
MNSTQQEFVQPTQANSDLQASAVLAPCVVNHPTCRVLLVESDASEQRILLEYLRTLDCEVDAVGNGQDAVAAVSQTAYDVILIDCQIPGLNGLDTAEAIRQLETQTCRSRSAVIIAMVANTLRQDQERAIAGGMNDYLSKPIHLEALTIRLQHWRQTLSLPHLSSSDCKQTLVRIEQDRPNLQIDWNHLHQISDNNIEFELELLQLFIQDSQDHLVALKAAIATQNCQKVEQEAHHLKGASANVGVNTMEFAAGQLEYQARHHQLSATSLLVEELEVSLQHLQTLVHHKSQLI